MGMMIVKLMKMQLCQSILLYAEKTERPGNKEEPTSKSRNTMSVSFKVTLSKEEEQETRRFLVGQDVASSLVYLKQKIATLFPALRRSEPVLSWVDEDGDEVVVASDEELEVALAALPGPVYKFRVRLMDTKKDETALERLVQGVLRFTLGSPVMAAKVRSRGHATSASLAQTMTYAEAARLVDSMCSTR